MSRKEMEPIRKVALVEAAIQEIGDRGSLDVTVAQIARRAGMSSGLAHHYFGSKDQMFAATMRHILAVFGAEMRGALAMCENAQDRIEAILRVSFSPTQFRPEMVSAWLNFYVKAQTSDDARRLLNIYHRRLETNLMHAYKQIDPTHATTLTRGMAAMIDGLYIRQAFSQDPLSRPATLTILRHYLDASLRKVTDE